MTLEPLWNAYQTDGIAVLESANPTEALGQFYLALLAFNANHFERAAELAQAAAASEPGHPLYPAAAHYLERVANEGKAHVYVDGEAFAAFIRGGGNVTLYNAVSKALKTAYEEYETLTLLDIGVGDGLALLPALTQNITRLDLLEPSGAMLSRTTAQLRAWNVPHRSYETTLQAFMPTSTRHWDIIQATWSLQSVPPTERPAVFAWLREHGARVLIAEFDVPEFKALFAPARVRYIVDHYENGLREYEGDGGLVAQGFLLPVLFGYFDQSAARTNWEGPLAQWQTGLESAGFTQIAAHKLMAYFWADAYLIDAR